MEGDVIIDVSAIEVVVLRMDHRVNDLQIMQFPRHPFLGLRFKFKVRV